MVHRIQSDWLGWALGIEGFNPASPLPHQRDSQEPSPAPQFESISSSVFSLLYGPTLTSIHDQWKNHSLDYTNLCWQSDASAF